MTDEKETADHYLKLLNEARRALANEIHINPDKSWMGSLMSRYTTFLKENGCTDEIAPIDQWHESSVEVTEAVLRSVGSYHSAVP